MEAIYLRREPPFEGTPNITTAMRSRPKRNRESLSFSWKGFPETCRMLFPLVHREGNYSQNSHSGKFNIGHCFDGVFANFDSAQISERVIVDAFNYYSLQGQVAPELRSLKDVEKPIIESGPKHGHGYPSVPNVPSSEFTPYVPVSQGKRRTNEEFLASVAAFQAPELQDHMESSSKVSELTDAQCLLTVPWVKAFAIHSKSWCK